MYIFSLPITGTDLVDPIATRKNHEPLLER